MSSRARFRVLGRAGKELRDVVGWIDSQNGYGLRGFRVLGSLVFRD